MTQNGKLCPAEVMHDRFDGEHRLHVEVIVDWGDVRRESVTRKINCKNCHVRLKNEGYERVKTIRVVEPSVQTENWDGLIAAMPVPPFPQFP